MSEVRRSVNDELPPPIRPTGDVAKPLGPYFGEYDENGVDLSLLRYMLSLTPRERVLRMQEFARSAAKLMEYGRRHRETRPDPNR